jgi:hypothetical protein
MPEYELDPFSIDLYLVRGRGFAFAFTEVVRQRHLERIAKPSADQERHRIRVCAKLQHLANILRSQIVEQPEHHLNAFQAVADVAVLPRSVLVDAADTTEEAGVVVTVANQGCHASGTELMTTITVRRASDGQDHGRCIRMAADVDRRAAFDDPSAGSSILQPPGFLPSSI